MKLRERMGLFRMATKTRKTLVIPQMGIKPFLSDKLIVRAFFLYPSIVQDDYPVGILDCFEPVGNGNDGASFDQRVNGFLVHRHAAKGNITVEMEDYGNMEKAGPIGTSLPRNDRQTTTGPGDIILYQGKYLVIYYDTNSWNFTRLGKIDNVTQAVLKSALGEGGVRVTLSLE